MFGLQNMHSFSMVTAYLSSLESDICNQIDWFKLVTFDFRGFKKREGGRILKPNMNVAFVIYLC